MKLQPCPFCGSEDVDFWRIHEHGEQEGYVQCRKCWAQGPLEDNWMEAEHAWNKRSQMDALEAQLADARARLKAHRML